MRCQVKRCKCEVYLLFYGCGVCEGHWSKHCDNVIDLKREFKIPLPREDDRKDVSKSVNVMSENSSVNISSSGNRDIRVFDDWKDYFNL